MPGSWVTVIPSFGQPIMPDGRPKNPFLTELEQVGTGKLTKQALQLLDLKHSYNIQTNTLAFRPVWNQITPNAINFKRNEYVYGFLIALYGTAQVNPCEYCSKRHGPKFVGCIRLNGFLDGCCANCAYAGGPVMDKCIEDYDPVAWAIRLAKRQGNGGAVVAGAAGFDKNQILLNLLRNLVNDVRMANLVHAKYVEGLIEECEAALIDAEDTE